jgi:Protein of unknown function (DUF1573)
VIFERGLRESYIRRRLAMLFLLPVISSCADGTSPDTDVVEPQPSRGVLSVDPPGIEFQAPDDGERGSRQVELRIVNTGSEPLRIGEVETRCGCTVPEDLARNLLPPGESEMLVVSVSPPRFGKRETSLAIITDSGETPRVVVPVVLQGAKLHPPYVESAPSQVRLTGRQPGELVEQEVLVRALESPGPPWVTGLLSSQQSVEAELVEVADEEVLTEEAVRRVYRFVIRSRVPESPLAIITDNLTFATGPAESMKRLPSISITADLTPVIRAVPREVRFRVNDNATFPLERTVLLIPPDDTPWSFSLPEDIPSWLQIVADQPAGDAGGVKRIRVRINEPVSEIVSEETPPHSEFVHVACTHPECDHADMTIVVSR